MKKSTRKGKSPKLQVLDKNRAVLEAQATVREVRVLGAIGVVEMHEPMDLRTWAPRFVEAGVWLRPFGRLVYMMPPYIIDPGDLSVLTGAVRRVLSEAG